MKFEIIFNPGNSIEHLEDIDYRLRNQEPMLLNMGLLLSEFMAAQWGQGWPPLAQSTLERKAREGFSDEILVRTGDLKEAVTGGEWNASRSGGGFVATLEVPSYGSFHIEGTSFMPVRDFTFVPDTVEAGLANIAEEWIFGGITT